MNIHSPTSLTASDAAPTASRISRGHNVRGLAARLVGAMLALCSCAAMAIGVYDPATGRLSDLNVNIPGTGAMQGSLRSEPGDLHTFKVFSIESMTPTGNTVPLPGSYDPASGQLFLPAVAIRQGDGSVRYQDLVFSMFQGSQGIGLQLVSLLDGRAAVNILQGGGGGGSNTSPAPAGSPVYVLSVTVTGLNDYYLGAASRSAMAGLSLLNNGGDRIDVVADGTTIFPTAIRRGDSYNVTVDTTPEPLVCTVNGGSGVVTNKHITTVRVNCGWPGD
jgi:hypothetical protein